MTNSDSVPEPFVVLAAFLDGEHVDGDALKLALSTDEGRDYLIDLLALRQAAARMGPVSFPAPGAERSRLVVRLTAAAAIALVASALGFVAGGRLGPPRDPGVPAQTVEAVIDVSDAVRAPQPTQVIRLQPSTGANPPKGN